MMNVAKSTIYPINMLEEDSKETLECIKYGKKKECSK